MSVEDDRIREAQAALEAARALMLAPSAQAVDGTIPHLERAVACLDAVQAAVRDGAGNPAVRAGLQKLRGAVRRVARLVESGAEFHLGWAQCAAVATAGYTAQGEPGKANCSGRLSVEG